MGSPISFSQLAQTPAPWLMLNSFINVAQQFEWEERRPGTLAPEVLVRHEGVGVVAAIVPWNVPQFVTMSKLAPALLSGCSIVIKPAPETPLDALVRVPMLEEAGVPKGVVSVVPAGREVGEHLVRHPGVDKVAFTGLDRRGPQDRGDLRRAAQARAASSSAASRPRSSSTTPTSTPRSQGLKFASLMNNGQACVAQTRILASKKRYDEVVDALSAMVGEPQGRRPCRRHHRDRSARRRAPAGAGREVHRAGPGRGRAGRRRRQRPSRGHREGLVRPARPCSPTSTTTCASRVRRSSAPSSR